MARVLESCQEGIGSAQAEADKYKRSKKDAQPEVTQHKQDAAERRKQCKERDAVDKDAQAQAEQHK